MHGQILVILDILYMYNWCYLTDFPTRMLEKVCKDPQMLADVFVNYDCDLEGPNLFERMVSISLFNCSQSIAYEFLIKNISFFFWLVTCLVIYLYQVSALSKIAQGSQIADTNSNVSSQTVSVKGSSLQVTTVQITHISLIFFWFNVSLTWRLWIAVLGEYSEVIGWLGATSKRFFKAREHCWV